MGFDLSFILNESFKDILDTVDLCSTATQADAQTVIEKVREQVRAPGRPNPITLPVPMSNYPPNASAAIEIVSKFNSIADKLAFDKMNRHLVAAQLCVRICQPRRINQKNQPLCGPNSFFHAIVQRSIVEYVEFITQLAAKGRASLRDLEIAPPQKQLQELKVDENRGLYSAPVEADMIVLAGLRASSVIGYTLDDLATGYTEPAKIYEWMVAAGYKDVIDKTLMTESDMPVNAVGRAIHSPGEGVSEIAKNNMSDAKQLADEGKAVIMLANVNLTKLALGQNVQQSEGLHWTLLRGMQIMLPQYVILSLLSWGSDSRLRNQKILYKDFLQHYRGFIAGTP